MNVMQQIRIEKATLNIGAGKDQAVLERGIKLIKHITGINPVKTHTIKRIPTWGLRPGLPIGCKLTLRGKKAEEIIESMLKAKNNKLKKTYFDNSGSVSFGLHEYIDIPNVKYVPEIGLLGLQICITLEKPGFHIKKRKIMARRIPAKGRISQNDAIGFMKQRFSITLEEE